MQRDELLALLTPEAMTLLDDAPAVASSADALALVTRLRAAGGSPATVAAVVTQAKLRRRALAKFGPFAERMLFTDAGLQQATRLQVAAHHADRFRQAGAVSVADLGCGIGADSMAFASLGLEVTAYDLDEVTAAIAAHNLAPFPNAEVKHGRAEEVDLGRFDALWFDPARRTTSGGSTARHFDPSDWSPALDFVFAAGRERPTGVKLGPGIDHSYLPADAETQWVSSGGDLVEATVWMHDAARAGIRRSAMVIGKRGATELTSSEDVHDAEVGELGAVLYEPDPAIIRARLIGDLARSLEATMISESIAWMTADTFAPSPFASAFSVREVLPLHVSSLKSELRKRDIGVLEIKKRGVDIDPAEFRRRLALKGASSAVLILTRIGDKRVAILADRLS
ncbi:MULTISPECIES: class I SAM-dependent methyltransferase [unclassified Pseudoclavibacter]|uniref:class I SAM-dependent methyltransferase n=1 Tax=unclassified Pseudoclavibacter TaxID=2615177 RepID=UPI001BA88699|nr:class I SAM-dependent methyltransferase [Pseudoclavibacter sp. Marseille-Q4354]MBS3177151.1 class I SAM-dependent methyltransferase [Pseudoclavibacter sp. Marseille-Q4354]